LQPCDPLGDSRRTKPTERLQRSRFGMAITADLRSNEREAVWVAPLLLRTIDDGGI